jgi:redox-regulated HSP33 family molecular chaperone
MLASATVTLHLVIKPDTKVHCSYCITAYGFRRMVPSTHGEYVCPLCGHLAEPRNPEFHCACARCRTMAVNIVYKAPSPLNR